jgi:hypothetical protein
LDDFLIDLIVILSYMEVRNCSISSAFIASLVLERILGFAEAANASGSMSLADLTCVEG